MRQHPHIILIALLLLPMALYAQGSTPPAPPANEETLELPSAPSASAPALEQKPIPVPALPSLPTSSQNAAPPVAAPAAAIVPIPLQSAPVVPATRSEQAMQKTQQPAPVAAATKAAEITTPAAPVSAPLPAPTVPANPTAPLLALPLPSAMPAANADNADKNKAITPPSAVADINALFPSAAPENNDAIKFSLMFNQEDMDTVNKILKTYDAYEPHKKSAGQKDNYSDILDSIKPDSKDAATAQVERRLPNVYLGSIVYSSPRQWMVTINGRQILSSANVPSHEFYVTRISRKEAEFLWKPSSFNDFPERFEQVTENGKKSITGVSFDNANRILKLDLRPNQTFDVDAIAIREGLIERETPLLTRLKSAVNNVINPGENATEIQNENVPPATQRNRDIIKNPLPAQ